jgi:CheY-like chemotaxis protein
VAEDAQSLRILVVDDNIDGADVLSVMLSDEGQQVRTAYDGREAMDAASRERPDLVFLDIGLPKLDGYEVARLMRADPGLKDTYLVALTAFGSQADKAKALEAGFDMHVIKPIDPATIYAVLEMARKRRDVTKAG